MLIFYKINNNQLVYLAGFDYHGHPIVSSNFDECLHFNLIGYDMLLILRTLDFFPFWGNKEVL